MDGKEPVYISVIIIAYNRKEFLLSAIKSVLNQTLDKKYYEIIVVKNFEDKTIDDFISSNKIINILSNKTGGNGKYIEGLEISKGSIISFLDDDDSFLNNKLEFVYNKFKNNDNLVYYHNDNIPVNEKGIALKGKEINKDTSFNPSCISIKRNAINTNNLKKIIANKSDLNWDEFIYLSALESGKKIMKGDEKLTYYMVHNSASNIVTDDLNEFKKHAAGMIEMSLNSFLLFRKMFISKKAINYINARIINLELDGYFYGLNKRPDDIINFMKSNIRPVSIRIKIFIAYILVRIHSNFKNIIIKKLWNNYKEKI